MKPPAVEKIEAAIEVVDRLLAVPWVSQPAYCSQPNRTELEAELAQLRAYLADAHTEMRPPEARLERLRPCTCDGVGGSMPRPCGGADRLGRGWRCERTGEAGRAGT